MTVISIREATNLRRKLIFHLLWQRFRRAIAAKSQDKFQKFERFVLQWEDVEANSRCKIGVGMRLVLLY